MFRNYFKTASRNLARNKVYSFINIAEFFATAGIIALLIALITVSFQAIKAAVANPVKNLRTE